MMQIRDSADVVGVCDALLRPLVSSPALTCCWRHTQREEEVKEAASGRKSGRSVSCWKSPPSERKSVLRSGG